MSNASLGRGLSELLGDNLANMDNKTNLQEIDLNFIEPGKYQPRQKIDAEELASLTESIKEKGVLQPIIVKFNNIIHKYEIIAGERRYRASTAAGLVRIPAIILDVSDQEAYEIALIENIQRENLNAMEEAQAIDKLIRKYSCSQEEAASKLGKSRTHIANMLRLLKLPEQIKQMLSNDELSMGHARALINKDNALELAQDIVNNNLSVRDAEKLAKDSSKKSKKALLNKYDTQKQQYLTEIASQLTDLVSLNIDIKHKNNKGKMTISFKNSDEMDHIIDIFEYFVSREAS